MLENISAPPDLSRIARGARANSRDVAFFGAGEWSAELRPRCALIGQPQAAGFRRVRVRVLTITIMFSSLCSSYGARARALLVTVNCYLFSEVSQRAPFSFSFLLSFNFLQIDVDE